jgi:ABC-2 type transport system permease protein
MAFAIFFSGMTLPLVLFPGWLGTVAEAMPFAGFLQVPADVWLGRHQGVDILGHLAFQTGWIVVLFGCCHATLRAATRKVVVQGG